jgi:hypothetical protein
MDEELKEPVKLLVDENGGKVWRTFEGEWLVGTAASGMWGEHKSRCGWWSVVRSKRGKFVLHFDELTGKERRSGITVFDSFDAMEPLLPPKVADKVAIAAGIRPEVTYPEVPLDV